MTDEKFLIEYEKLLDKGYCDCNEMNCIDNNAPRRILNIAKRLQQENQKMKEVIDTLEFIKARAKAGATQETINKLVINFVNSYIK